MAIWLTIPVTDQPSLTIRSWSVVQLPDGDRHFVGYCVENQEGRVSSAIQSIDPRTLRARTATGRVYQLAGGPGLNSDAQYVWGIWAAGYKIETWTDLSNEVWSAHLRSTAVAEADGSSRAIAPDLDELADD